MKEKITLQDITEAFSSSLGIEKTQALIKGAIQEAGLLSKDFYSSDEALKICGILEAKGEGFIKTIAGVMSAKIICGTQDMRKINELIINLQSAKRKIEDWSRTLEEKVKVRTRELMKAQYAMTVMMQDLEKSNEQLKATQAQLIQSAKMASVGLLAGGVAHEINNPLTGVLNNVQLIRMMAGQKKDFNIDDFKELLAAVENSALRCKNITQALLNFSHSSKGLFKPIFLNEIIEKVFVLMEHELKLQNVSISKELQPDLPQIQGDSQLLQQVIFDIVNNAQWAIQNKPEEKIGTVTLKTGYDPEKKIVSLSISDNGVGIPKENLDKIFEPFFTTKQVGEGTGLGLSVVYNIIEAHRGSIEVVSEIGKGATFRILLPASAKIPSD